MGAGATRRLSPKKRRPFWSCCRGGVKILFDENVPRPLKRFLADHEVSTVQGCGWRGLRGVTRVGRGGVFRRGRIFRAIGIWGRLASTPCVGDPTAEREVFDPLVSREAVCAPCASLEGVDRGEALLKWRPRISCLRSSPKEKSPGAGIVGADGVKARSYDASDLTWGGAGQDAYKIPRRPIKISRLAPRPA
jgi:hypothetical protein